jgi:hypothetical protein
VLVERRDPRAAERVQGAAEHPAVPHLDRKLDETVLVEVERVGVAEPFAATSEPSGS